MKLVKIIILILLILIIAAVTAGAYYINTNGRAYLEHFLAESFDENVTVGAVAYRFPLGLEVRNVSINNVFQSERLNVQIGLASLRDRQINLSSVRLEQPVLTINRDKVPGDIAPEGRGAPAQQGKDETPAEQKIRKPAPVTIDRLAVHNGTFHYDGGHRKNAIKFSLKDVRVTLENVGIPHQTKETVFDIKGKLIKEQGLLTGGRVSAAGWANLTEKNMKGNLKIVDNDGKAGLLAEVISIKNQMDVKGTINVSNLAMLGKEKLKTDSVGDILLNALSGVDVQTKFSFKTKMDDFDIGPVSFSGSVGVKE